MPKIKKARQVGAARQVYEHSAFKGIKCCKDCGKVSRTNQCVCKNDPFYVPFKSGNWDEVVSGLGRRSMRGVKLCGKCNTVNGNRNGVCKNKKCNERFTDAYSLKKLAETSRLDTGTFTKVFSVRVGDQRPEFRGFVQLPLDEGSDTIQSSALCFVDNCHGNFNTKVLQCHEPRKSKRSFACSHINAAINCASHATPLWVSADVHISTVIKPETKETLQALFVESSGPVVQRVSRDVMAVKCPVSTQFPLGFLHTTFVSGRTDNDLRFLCPCSQFTETAQEVAADGRCVHFYACICAFISQETLREEFAPYIRLEVSVSFSKEPTLGPHGQEVVFSSLFETCAAEILQNDMTAILSDVVDAADEMILGAGRVLPQVSTILSQRNRQLSAPVVSDVFSTEALVDEELEDDPGVPVMTYPVQEATILEIPSEEDPNVIVAQSIPLRMEDVPRQKRKKALPNLQHFTYLEWLGSVTEMINQNLHYQCPGDSSTVVIRTPEKYFIKFKDSIYRSRKKTPPGIISTFQRTDTPPFGTFFKHSWLLNDRVQVKGLFDTPNIKLKFCQTFARTSDGVYELIDGNTTSYKRDQLVRTYLRIGWHKKEPEPAAFQVDWIPDLLPESHIGEVHIRFQFGRILHLPRHDVTIETNEEDLI